MAAGVQQASNGATLTFEDHSNAEAGGDSAYSPEELYAQVVAKGFKQADGTTPTIVKQVGAVTEYLSGNNIQNGDGSGSQPTRFLLQAGEQITFAAGKGYDISSVGLSGRTLEGGFKDTPIVGDPAGYGGGSLVLGKTTILRGILKMYGMRVATVGSGTSLQLAPGFLGSGSEVLDCYLEAFGAVVLGSALGEIYLLLNNLVAGRGLSSTSVLSNTFATIARGNRLYAITAGRCINTAGEVKARGLVLGGTPSTSLVRLSGIAGILTDPVYQCRDVPLSDFMSQLTEYFSFSRPVYGGSPLTAIPGISVEVLNKDLVTVVDAVTDANGRIDFGAADPLTRNALKLRVLTGGSTVVAAREDPFTVRANHKPPFNPAFAPYEETSPWPGEIWVADGFSEQLFPIQAPIILKPASPTNAQACFGQSEIAKTLAMIGQDVSFGGMTTKGVIDERTVPVLTGEGASVLSKEIVISIEMGSLPGLAVGYQVSADGIAYRVYDMRQVGDGGMTELRVAFE